MAYQLVILDFDGTLADSADWVRRTINHVADRYRFKRIADDEFALLRGRDNRAIIRHLGVPMWKMPFIANHMRALMSRDADQIRLFPGASDLLRRLHAGGVTLAIVSSNTEDNIRRILGAENAALISAYACGASIFGKAAAFRRVLKRTGLPPAKTFCIGDETRDIEAAAALNLACGAVTWGYASADLLRAHGPTLVFDRIEDIGALLTAEPAL